MPYLIDGHNLIPKVGLRLDSPDDEMELVGMLQEFSRLSRREVQVFFDGAPAGEARSRKFGAVTAHFVRISSSADKAIKAELRRLGRAARNWTVVTSDHEVQDVARAARAAVSTSEEFARQLKQLLSGTNSPAADRPVTSEEVEDWLRLFNKRK